MPLVPPEIQAMIIKLIPLGVTTISDQCHAPTTLFLSKFWLKELRQRYCFYLVFRTRKQLQSFKASLDYWQGPLSPAKYVRVLQLNYPVDDVNAHHFREWRELEALFSKLDGLVTLTLAFVHKHPKFVCHLQRFSKYHLPNLTNLIFLPADHERYQVDQTHMEPFWVDDEFTQCLGQIGALRRLFIQTPTMCVWPPTQETWETILEDLEDLTKLEEVTMSAGYDEDNREKMLVGTEWEDDYYLPDSPYISNGGVYHGYKDEGGRWHSAGGEPCKVIKWNQNEDDHGGALAMRMDDISDDEECLSHEVAQLFEKPNNEHVSRRRIYRVPDLE